MITLNCNACQPARAALSTMYYAAWSCYGNQRCALHAALCHAAVNRDMHCHAAATRHVGIAAGKLRSADCVAEGRVQVVVINKKDFMDLDNPLLAWMLDSDAVTTVLRVCLCWHQITVVFCHAYCISVPCCQLPAFNMAGVAKGVCQLGLGV